MDDGEAWGPEQHGKGGGAHSTATNQRNQGGREGTVCVTLYVFNTCMCSSKMPTVEANHPSTSRAQIFRNQRFSLDAAEDLRENACIDLVCVGYS